MNARQIWLQERLLIPAGILPPPIKYSDLHYYEEIRTRITNVGFEYLYLLDQDLDAVKKSPIGGRIKAVHYPFPSFGHNSLKSTLLKKLVNKIVYGKNAFPPDFAYKLRKSIDCCLLLGAQNLTIHISYFGHDDFKENLLLAADLTTKAQIRLTIENEGPQANQNPQTDWLANPIIMLKTLENIIPGNKFLICFDTSSLINSSLGVMDTLEKVFDRVGHVHLSNNKPGLLDAPTDTTTPELAEVVKYLYNHHYQGLITAEVDGAQGPKEQFLAQLYAASTLLGLKMFKSQFFNTIATHFATSARYLLTNI